MALDDVKWKLDHDLDLHVLRNRPSRLLRDVLLFVDDQGNETPFAAYTGGDITSITFSANFLGAPHAHGVQVDAASGQITPDNPAPAGVKLIRNFIVTAVIVHRSARLASPHELRVRVQVHENIRKIWLTPNPYRGHQNAEAVSFSVLAEFDNDVVGDITNWSDWGLIWSSNRTDDIDIDPNSGILNFKKTVAASNPVKLSVALPPLPPPPHLMSEADVNAGEPWTNPTDVEFIAGPGPSTRNDKPNLLFLPDGFQASERAAFKKLIQNLADKLQHKEATRPFDLLKDEINYWMAWVPSEDKGISVLDEVGNQSPKGGGRVRADAVPFATRHRPLGTAWEIGELIDAVGLPLRAEAPATAGAKVPDWQGWFDAGISAGTSAADEVSLDVYREWRSFRDRTLVNEQNTAFGIAIGYRPALEVEGNGLMGRHYRRLTDADLDRFLLGLSISAGPTIGHLWSTSRGGGAAGKDFGLICFVGRSYRSAGTNRGDYFSSALRGEFEHRLKTTAIGRVLRVDDHAIVSAASLELRVTVAHEATHGEAFHIDDEYGAGFNLPASALDDVRASGNLQPRVDLTIPGSNLNGAHIKWLWPRIREAAVLTVTLRRLTAPGIRPARFEAGLPAWEGLRAYHKIKFTL